MAKAYEIIQGDSMGFHVKSREISIECPCNFHGISMEIEVPVLYSDV